MNKRIILFVLASAVCLPFRSPAFAEPLKVDINTTTTRTDLNSRNMANWIVPGGQQATQRFGQVTITLRAAGGGLSGSMWKGGIDTGAVMVTDGAANYEGSIEMVLSGLTPGKHSVVTYHNLLSLQERGRYDIYVNGKVAVEGIVATHRIRDNDEAGTAYVEFDAEAGKDVVIAITPNGGNAVILNGFGIDIGNPMRTAMKPVPANGDEHAPEDAVLKWRASKTALSHDVYLGENLEAVASATRTSGEFRGNVKSAEFATRDLDSWKTYYWRVDEVNSDSPAPVKSDVWNFRPRHLAFPEAEGYGRFAIGGRGGRVIEVTTLNDGGPGSFREALNTPGPRTIVFRVGGTINLRSGMGVRYPYCTIAGQTAPGDGILLAGRGFGFGGVHDIIVRNIRIRVGDESGQTMDGSGFANCNNSICDHISIAWSIDEGFSSRGAHNITLQRSLITEALNMSVHSHYVGTGKGHSFAGSISGDVGSFHHNLVVNCAGRNWSLAGGLFQGGEFAGRLDIRNNVVYNWVHRTTDGGVRELNYVGNYYIPGPATTFMHLIDPDAGFHNAGVGVVWNPESYKSNQWVALDDYQRYYLTGNVMEGHPEMDADNWKNGGALLRSIADGGPGPENGERYQLIRKKEPLFPSYVKTDSALDAYKSVVADAGANIPHPDPVDQRALNSIINRTSYTTGSKTGFKGIIDSQIDAGGFPVMKGGEAPADSDHDGMSDDWETAHNLNPHDASDGPRKSTDGYSNLELYLNSIRPDPNWKLPPTREILPAPQSATRPN